MARPAPSTMFDPEVVDELRRQFDAADKDGNGEIDSAEACRLFAASCDPTASPEQLQRTAEGLRHQLDSDRSGTISFDEYCFRFGRRYQMERNRQRRAGGGGGPDAAPAASSGAPAASNEAAAGEAPVGGDERARLAEELEKEREALRREREALEQERRRLQEEATRREAETGAGGAQRPQPSPPSPPTPPPLGAGVKVVLQGLRGAPELNGRTATVVRLDEATGRFVVELDGGGGSKSLRSENLVPQGLGAATGSVQGAVKETFFRWLGHIQVWLAEYEWWQIALAGAVIVVFIGAWLQVGSRYPGSAGGAGRRDADAYRDDGRHREGRRASARAADLEPERDLGGRGYDDRDRSYHDERHEHGDAYRYRERVYDDRDDGYGSGYGYGGGGGLLDGVIGGNLQWYLVVGGLVFLCWKGIIPVHRMDWFQLYMLWNMVSPLLLGQGGGRVPYGGYGRRRRFF